MILIYYLIKNKTKIPNKPKSNFKNKNIEIKLTFTYGNCLIKGYKNTNLDSSLQPENNENT